MRRLLAFIITVGLALLSGTEASAKSRRSCADARHILLRKCDSVVIADSMPGNDYYEHGSRSATSPEFLGLDEDQDEAAGFLIPSDGNVLLSSLDLALWYRGGSNSLDVYLVEERPRVAGTTEAYEPNDQAIIEHWRLSGVVPASLGATGNVVHIDSAMHPKLLAGNRYWVYISVPESDSAIGWLSHGLEYGGPGWFAERNSAIGFQWATFAQPGFSMRVTALR